MPIVPKPENFSVMPQVSSGGGFRNPMSEGMATLPGQQIQAMGDAMQKSAAEIGRIYAQIEADANATRVQAAKTKMVTLLNDLTTNAGHSGYADKVGKDALPEAYGGKSAAEFYGSQGDAGIEDIVKRDLTNDAQRNAFLGWAAPALHTFIGNVEAHSAKQIGPYKDSLDDATAATAGNTIITQSNDPEAVGESLANMAGAIASKAARAGMAPEWAQIEIQKQQSQSLAAVVGGLIDTGRVKDAADFRARYNDYFTGAQRDTLDARIKSETDIGLMQKSVSDASAVMLKRNGGNGGPRKAGYMTEAEFIHQSIEGLGPDAAPSLVEQVTSMAGRQYHMLTTSIHDSRHHAVSAALVGLENNGGSYYNLAPNVRAAIPDDEVDTVKAHADQVTNGPVETDPVVYQQLSDDKALATISDPAFQRVSLQSLSSADRIVFAARRAELRDPAKTDNGPGSIDRESLDAGLAARLQALGISPNPPQDDPEAMRQVGTIRKQSADAVLRQQAILGRKQDAGGILKILDDQFLKASPVRDSLLAAPWAHDRPPGMADRPTGQTARPSLRLNLIPTDQAPDSAAVPDEKTGSTVGPINDASTVHSLRHSKITNPPLEGWPYHLNIKDNDKEGIATFGKVRGVVDGKATQDHQGIDIQAPLGTNVTATGSGKVVFSGWQKGYGYCVQIDHGDGIYSFYAHVEKGSMIALGKTVQGGETIARVGKSGNAASRMIDAHLHFELRTTPNPPHGLEGRFDPAPYVYPLRGAIGSAPGN